MCEEHVEQDICGRGGCENLATEEHSCPFKEEINDDYDSLCRCCSDCQYECAMDI